MVVHVNHLKKKSKPLLFFYSFHVLLFEIQNEREDDQRI